MLKKGDKCPSYIHKNCRHNGCICSKCKLYNRICEHCDISTLKLYPELKDILELNNMIRLIDDL